MDFNFSFKRSFYRIRIRKKGGCCNIEVLCVLFLILCSSLTVYVWVSPYKILEKESLTIQFLYFFIIRISIKLVTLLILIRLSLYTLE